MHTKTVLVSALLSLFIFNNASANFFKNVTNLIEGNYESLRYGISVADVNNDGTNEFVVAGFGSENLAKFSLPKPATTNSLVPSLFTSATDIPYLRLS